MITKKDWEKLIRRCELEGARWTRGSLDRWMTEGFAGMERFFGSSTGRGFRARYYASEFEARSGASGRKTTFNRPKWKRREQFFERGNYRFVWSPRSLALQEADRDIGHIPGVRKARREPNRDLHVFSPPLSPSFPS